MKRVLPPALVLSAGALVAVALPTVAQSLGEIIDSPFAIENASSANALSITQERSVGTGRDDSGAVFLDNTKNMNTGLTLYSNAGSSVAQPLARFEIDNTAWDEEVLYIRSDSPTSRGLIRLDSPAPEIEFVETDQGGGASGKFEVRVQHDEFQINSRRADDTTFENKITMTHDGDLVLKEGTLVAEHGINVTGGCIALNGACIGASSGTSASASPLSLTSGAPASAACNSYSERGAIALDAARGKLYVCSGPERGWDSVQLTD